MRIEIPDMGVVVLIGTSGSGKSTFAAKHFLETEILSSDRMRGWVADDENDQSSSNEAFDALHHILGLRAKRGKVSVIDATNVQPESRRQILAIAKAHYVLSVAIVFDIDPRIAIERNLSRPDRQFGPHVVRNQAQTLRRGKSMIRREGFLRTYFLNGQDDVDRAEIVRTRLFNDKRDLTGPFDIIGDVHGCTDELKLLFEKLGYTPSEEFGFAPPEGRTAIFLGDLVDRGPDSVGALKIAMKMVESGAALAVPGNHDVKLLKALNGRDVARTHGLDKTLEDIAKETPEEIEHIKGFIDSLISHYVLDGGNLVVAHAGMKEAMQGRGSGRVREFALYGETTGETDEFGLPVRFNWAGEYRGHAFVVYGHVPTIRAEWLNRTICLDTGAVFGGELTALRYPEMELVSVPALQEYAVPIRPLVEDMGRAAQHAADDWLDVSEVTGRRFIDTELRRRILIDHESSVAALEVMSRFAADPRWLAYLPPTMSPCETSEVEGYLERPEEALAYYADLGVQTAVCEEKHMGSRTVAVLCRNPEVAMSRFGFATPSHGVIVTRTGRPFFNDTGLEAALLSRLTQAVEKAGLWEELQSDWMILDCEMMPWSSKAIGLLRSQYAAVGAAATQSFKFALEAIDRAEKGGVDLGEIPATTRARADLAARYIESYRHYCWPVTSLDDYRLAPFHLLASEGKVHTDQNHEWHMTTLARLAEHDPIFIATPFRKVDLTSTEEVAAACAWWDELTATGKEGMVVKPLDFIGRSERGEVIQPAIKCRGKEYLRIIYGPDYDLPLNLARLRKRGLGRKRNLATREFALGIEALNRFVRRQPLREVHECVFGVLALETEPVDLRL